MMRFAEAGWMVSPPECSVWDRRDQERVVIAGRTWACDVQRAEQELQKANRYSRGCVGIQGLGRSWHV